MDHAQRTTEMSTRRRPGRWALSCIILVALASACAPPPHEEDDIPDLDTGASDLENAIASITMGSSSYSVGQQISVKYANLPSGATHWIGLYNATSADTNFITWQYASSTGSGTLSFSGLQAGSYEARLFYNDSYQRQAKASFSVGQVTDLCPNDPNKTAPGHCGCGKAEGTCSGTGYNVYYGYLHSHTERSDGSGSPAQAYAAAKAAGLDFFSVTDHDYYPDNMTSTDWSTVKTAAAKYDNDPQFVSFWGFEWTSDTTQYDPNGKGLGHLTVINSDTWCNVSKSGTDTLNGLVSWLNNQPSAFAFFNHPGQYNTTFDKFAFNKTNKIVGMELWNRTSDYYSNDGFYSN
ncbi:MAG: PHP domain-containing protein, partial [Byssovorax sp.]